MDAAKAVKMRATVLATKNGTIQIPEPVRTTSTLASACIDFGIRPNRGYRSMDTRIFLPILFAVLVLFAIAALLILRKRKSDQLKQRFGPEYDRVVQQHGGTRPAEAVLAEREKRVEKFSIHALPAGDRERYADEWAGVQRRFVDDPSMAVTEADKLVTKVMTARRLSHG
jgi:hypothetical protein